MKKKSLLCTFTLAVALCVFGCSSKDDADISVSNSISTTTESPIATLTPAVTATPEQTQTPTPMPTVIVVPPSSTTPVATPTPANTSTNSEKSDDDLTIAEYVSKYGEEKALEKFGEVDFNKYYMRSKEAAEPTLTPTQTFGFVEWIPGDDSDQEPQNNVPVPTRTPEHYTTVEEDLAQYDEESEIDNDQISE